MDGPTISSSSPMGSANGKPVSGIDGDPSVSIQPDRLLSLVGTSSG